MNLDIDLSKIPHQNKTFNATERYVISIGAVGSSKSFTNMAIALSRALQYPNSWIIIMRKTYNELKNNTCTTFFDRLLHVNWDDDYEYKKYPFLKSWNRSRLCLTFTNGSKIYFIASGGRGASEAIRGSEPDLIILEEITEMEEDVIQWCDSRLRGGSGCPHQIFCSGNPGPKSSWVYKRFVAKQDPSHIYIQSKTIDNPWIPKDYIESLERNPDENFKRRMLYGEFVTFEGAVFPEFNRDIHVIPHTKPDKFLHWSMDYGYQHPTTLLSTCTLGDKIYIFSEFGYEKTIIKDICDDWVKKGVPKKDKIICDPSMAQRNAITGSNAKEEFFNYGYRGLISGENSWQVGIDRIKMLLLKNKLVISERCEHLISEIESYSYKTTTINSTTLEDRPVKVNDDYIDPIRYSVMDDAVANFTGIVTPIQVITNKQQLQLAKIRGRKY